MTELVHAVKGCTCSIVIEHLVEDDRVTVEKIFSEDVVIVGLRLTESCQSSGRNLLQRRAVDLVPHATHVDAHTVTRQSHASVQ